MNAPGEKPLMVVQFCKLPSKMHTKFREIETGGTVAIHILYLTTLMNLKSSEYIVIVDLLPHQKSLMHRLESMGIPIQEPMSLAFFLSLSNLTEYD